VQDAPLSEPRGKRRYCGAARWVRRRCRMQRIRATFLWWPFSCAGNPGENVYRYVVHRSMFIHLEGTYGAHRGVARQDTRWCDAGFSQVISRRTGRDRTRVPRMLHGDLLAHMLLGGDETFDITGPMMLDKKSEKVYSPCTDRDKAEDASLHFVG
jgi:hypothetical protein